MAPPLRAPFGFRAKLTVLAVLLVSVPLAVAGVSLFDVNADAVKTLARELQLAILEDVARTIDAHVAQAVTDVTAVARALGGAAQPQEARLGMAVALVEAAEAVDQVAVFDAGGRFIDRDRKSVV